MNQRVTEAMAVDRSGAHDSLAVPALLLQRKCACGQHTFGGECAACSGEKTTLQRKVSLHTSSKGVHRSVHEVLNSPGQPLNSSLCSYMESHFGQELGGVQVSPVRPHVAFAPVAIGPAGDRFEQEADKTADAVMQPELHQAASKSAPVDFSQVRVHADEQASRSAEEIGALAFTVGSHIVFGQGQFAPETSKGRHLLAHELTHVLQQGGQGTSIQRKVKEKTPCAVHAYDNSNPKDTAVIPKSGGIGVGSV